MTAAIQASEERTKVYVDAKMSEVNSQFAQINNRIDGVDKRLNFAFTVLGWLFALVIAALGIPQLIIAFRQRGQERLQSSVEELYAVHSEVLTELKQLRAENESFRGAGEVTARLTIVSMLAYLKGKHEKQLESPHHRLRLALHRT